MSDLNAVAHRFAALHLRAGSLAIDATIGNGHDTLFLAERVGPTGRVHGFDIQSEAITNTTRRLTDAGLMDRVTLYPIGHEHMAQSLPQETQDCIGVVLFNLGYLPGGDRSVITKSATTLPALAQALELLAPGGLLLITLYPGHPGGVQEAADVTRWAQSLDPAIATASVYRLLNRSPDAPRLLLIHRGIPANPATR